MLAALGNGVKGSKWFSLMDKVTALRTLALAWERVRANNGAAGVDRISIERFAVKADQYLKELSEDLRTKRYRPDAVRRTYIPKGPGQTRPLGIPTVKDRVVQTALKLVLEPIYEQEFLPVSYGFRPERGCKDALREVDGLLKAGSTWVVDADLKSYFDTIPHQRLMERVKERVSDGNILELIQAFLDQDILDGAKRWTPTRGTPQGAVLSPLLANLYLHPLDVELTEAGYRIVRYADDFVILCRSREEAKNALSRVRDWVDANGLTLHPDKTHLGNCMEQGQGFEFLGYRFESGQRWVRKKSLSSLKERLRQRTRRTRGDSMESVIQDLNPMLRGWFSYFKHAHHYTFKPLDGMIRRRLRAILRKQNKRPGMGRCYADHRRWPNAYFASLGLFTLYEAHCRASQSR
jgi:RNA-directed DNA polymerase